jgi:hypothetical protein
MLNALNAHAESADVDAVIATETADHAVRSAAETRINIRSATIFHPFPFN